MRTNYEDIKEQVLQDELQIERNLLKIDDPYTQDYFELSFFEAPFNDPGPEFVEPESIVNLDGVRSDRVIYDEHVISTEGVIMPFKGSLGMTAAYLKNNRLFGVLAQDAPVIYDVARAVFYRAKPWETLCYPKPLWQSMTMEPNAQYPIVDDSRVSMLDENGVSALKTICTANVADGDKLKQALKVIIRGFKEDTKYIKLYDQNAWAVKIAEDEYEWLDVEDLFRRYGLVRPKFAYKK